MASKAGGRQQTDRVTCAKCGVRLGGPDGGKRNTTGYCHRCWGSYGPRCPVCERVFEGGGRRRCQECAEGIESFLAAWASVDSGCEAQLPPEEKERRINVYGDRAALGLDLFAGRE